MSEEKRLLHQMTQEHGEIRQNLLVLELVVGVLIICAVSWYTMETLKLPEPYNPVDIGAGGFPLLLSIATFIAMGLYVVDCIARYMRREEVHYVKTGRPFYVLCGVMVFVGQALLFDKIGAFACIPLFSFLTMIVAGERRPVHVIGVPIAVTAGIYIVFSLLLDVYFL